MPYATSTQWRPTRGCSPRSRSRRKDQPQGWSGRLRRAKHEKEPSSSAFETGHIVRFKIFGERRALRLESNLGAFAREPILLFRIVVGSIAFDCIGPALNFLGLLGRTMTVEPSNDLFIGGTGTEQLFDLLGRKPLEVEEHLIERTGEMILADTALEIGAALIDHAGHQRVAAETAAGTAWWLFGEVFWGVRCAHRCG